MLFCLTGMLLGCGGDGARGVNRDRDRPRSADKADKADKTDKADKADKPKK